MRTFSPAGVTLLLLMMLSSLAFASGSESACKQKEDTERLACYDLTTSYKKPADDLSKASDQLANRPMVIISESAAMGNIAELKVVDKPATFDLARTNGDNSARVNAGLLLAVPLGLENGAEFFTGASWKRDITVPAKKKDVRAITAGVTGVLVHSKDETKSLYGTTTIGYSKDLFDTMSGNKADFHLSYLDDRLLDDRFIVVVPYAGMFLDRRNGGTVVDGNYRSVYVGVSATHALENWLNAQWAQGVTLSAGVERFHDWSTPALVDERNETSSYFELKYQFQMTDPKSPWKPSISLSRKVGENVREGGDPLNVTMLSLGITRK